MDIDIAMEERLSTYEAASIATEQCCSECRLDRSIADEHDIVTLDRCDEFIIVQDSVGKLLYFFSLCIDDLDTVSSNLLYRYSL